MSKTVKTPIDLRGIEPIAPGRDCVVVMHTPRQAWLGRRFTLSDPTRVGRAADSEIALDEDAVAERQAHFEQRDGVWFFVADDPAQASYCNNESVAGAVALANGDRVRIGGTVLKYIVSTDVEALYHEQIYRLISIDDLTQIYNRRYLQESLSSEIALARRRAKHLGVVLFDVERGKDDAPHGTGDAILKEIARVVQPLVRGDGVFARHGGDRFCIALPSCTPEEPLDLARTLQETIATHGFSFQGEPVPVTLQIGTALLTDQDMTPDHLLARADRALRAIAAAAAERRT